MKNNISIVLSIHNGEKYLHACLESIKDLGLEIIVIDHESTDKTADIAKKFTTKIFYEKNDPQKIDIQKNIGFSKATGEWILSLDADEEVSEDLVKEIHALTDDEEISAYKIPRKNIIFGKEIMHAGWAPDYQIRLFRKEKGKFMSSHVHEALHVEGKIDTLRASLIHHNYDTVSQFLKKMIVYAENEADEKIRNGYVFHWKDALTMPNSEFLSRYFAREGYKDGLHGLVLCLLQAVYHFTIFCYLWEKNKFIDKSENEIVDVLPKVTKELENEFSFWMTKVTLSKTKNIGKKASYKLLQKIKSVL